MNILLLWGQKPVRYRENRSTLLLDFDIDLPLSLPRTRRQIYSEASLVFYCDSTFFFHYPLDIEQFQKLSSEWPI
jgi:hypothetical protein